MQVMFKAFGRVVGVVPSVPPVLMKIYDVDEEIGMVVGMLYSDKTALTDIAEQLEQYMSWMTIEEIKFYKESESILVKGTK